MEVIAQNKVARFSWPRCMEWTVHPASEDSGDNYFSDAGEWLRIMRGCLPVLCVVCEWNAIVCFSKQQLISYTVKHSRRISDGMRMLRMQLMSVTIRYHQT